MNLLRALFGRQPAERKSTKKATSASDDFDVEVVGESQYQDALGAICGKRTKDGVDKIINAALVPENNNRHDSNAVRVEIAGKTVGYLSREDAKRFRATRGKGKANAKQPCRAHIVGGWDRGKNDRGHYGVRLDVKL